MALNRDLLGRGLSALGLPPDGALADGLLRYGEAIEEWNPAYGLVGASGDELVVKHLLDSLAPLPLIQERITELAALRGRQPLRLADLGTGAGLPGIPLALALPDLRVSLVERMGKRLTFLKAQVEALGLDNAEVVEAQVEQVRGTWDLLTFRAFRPFERKLFKKVFRLCAPDGFVLAYKGRRDRAEGELPEIEGLYRGADILPLQVPFLEEERCLVVLRPAKAPTSSP